MIIFLFKTVALSFKVMVCGFELMNSLLEVSIGFILGTKFIVEVLVLNNSFVFRDITTLTSVSFFEFVLKLFNLLFEIASTTVVLLNLDVMCAEFSMVTSLASALLMNSALRANGSAHIVRDVLESARVFHLQYMGDINIDIGSMGKIYNGDLAVKSEKFVSDGQSKLLLFVSIEL